jgi:hypothetical protein
VHADHREKHYPNLHCSQPLLYGKVCWGGQAFSCIANMTETLPLNYGSASAHSCAHTFDVKEI